MHDEQEMRIEELSIEDIYILNPRVRDKAKHRQITGNIKAIGLKRPITVCPRTPPDDKGKFDLVCGQGRLEAFLALGEKRIPARIIDASREECLLMSLTENIARRNVPVKEQVHEIVKLRDRGDTNQEIADKIGVTEGYIREILNLYDNGEERLLDAVDRGKVPLSIALMIVRADDDEVQSALHQAYEKGLLRGKELGRVRKIIQKRKIEGKLYGTSRTKRRKPRLSPELLVKKYREDIKRNHEAVKQASLCAKHIEFLCASLRTLYSDKEFSKLLAQQELESMPRKLAELIGLTGSENEKTD